MHMPMCLNSSVGMAMGRAFPEPVGASPWSGENSPDPLGNGVGTGRNSLPDAGEISSPFPTQFPYRVKFPVKSPFPRPTIIIELQIWPLFVTLSFIILKGILSNFKKTKTLLHLPPLASSSLLLASSSLLLAPSADCSFVNYSYAPRLLRFADSADLPCFSVLLFSLFHPLQYNFFSIGMFVEIPVQRRRFWFCHRRRRGFSGWLWRIFSED